jgi:hypothetical protein
MTLTDKINYLINPSFSKTVLIPNLSVTIYSAEKETGWSAKWETIPGRPPTFEMRISGKMIDGKIVMDKLVAAHEIQHLLNIENPEFANPDKDRVE